jgi:hypothetical protein
MLNPLLRTPDIVPDSVGVLGLCASVITDVAGTMRRSRTLVRALEKNMVG